MNKRSLLFLAMGLLAITSANAQLAHRYNLNTDGTDSIGGANGTLANNATITGGMLVLNGSGGDINANKDYLSLPATVGTGITGSFSIQIYATLGATGTADYSSLFSFATGQDNFLLLNPNRGGQGGSTTVDFRQGTLSSGTGEFNYDSGSQLLAGNAQHDLILTYDATTGVSNLYNNGVLAAMGTPGTGYSFAAAAAGSFDGIGGNGPYGDPSFSGSINDFRIFSQSLTQTQVTRLDGLAAGADATNTAITAAIPEPSAWTAALAGMASLLGLQRFRRKAV